MTRRDRLIEQVERLTHLARTIMMKRMLTDVEPNPHLNFWRLIYGNQLDIAVIEWCKLFGSDSEATHWKKIVPKTDHLRYRAGLLASIGATETTWATYWKEMKKYRDNMAAHQNSLARVPRFPKLDMALKSSYYHYRYVIGRLRGLGVRRFPDDLDVYCAEFASLAKEIATKAIAATSTVKERVL